jgi:hypothetical protein
MNLHQIIEEFYKTIFKSPEKLRTVFSLDDTPVEMMNSSVSNSGWFTWKPIPGTLSYETYHEVEQKFNVVFPKSFIEWHKRYYFLTCASNLASLPFSYPSKPLQEIIDGLNYDFAKDLIMFKLYPFASDGGDRGIWAFDGRVEMDGNEYPVRLCDYDIEILEDNDIKNLTQIIFSSFPKLLECITHFLKGINTRPDFELILEFFQIDPEGAGKPGFDYWLNLSTCLREQSEEEGQI